MQFSRTFSALVLAPVFVSLVVPTCARGGNFLTAGIIHGNDVQKWLDKELGGSAIQQKRFQDGLSNMYHAMPKNSEGRLTHQGVRYALHRYFAHQHGWFIRGLEPNTDPKAAVTEWVPTYLQDLLEDRLGHNGTDLGQLSATAAALVDLVHKEAVGRVMATYHMSELIGGESVEEEDAGDLVKSYYIGFLIAGNFSASSYEQLLKRTASFMRNYRAWPAAEEWLLDILKTHLIPRRSESREFSFKDIAHVASKIGEEYYKFNDQECVDLKVALRKLQGRKPGRVRLSAYYNTSMYSHWDFSEKKEYLRTLGVLDESDPSQPYVIIPNYAMARPNCLDASNIYTICCRNECEELMGSLESSIGLATATPERIVGLVTALPSGSVAAPRTLSDALLGRLNEVAERHGGQVPLHGRLFAQWMHHAYPLECPYPHEYGTVNPLSPNEWMRETGNQAHAGVEEMLEHVAQDSCATSGSVDCAGETAEIAWSDNEELLIWHPKHASTQTMTTETLVI